MSLRSAIDKLQAQEQDMLAIKDNKDQFIKQWQQDIIVLHGEIRDYLKEFVADKSIGISLFDTVVEENGLGSYTAPAMSLRITDKTVQCTPRGRLTADSTGRLDLWRSDRPSVSDRLKIVRGIGKGGRPGSWTIEQITNPSFKSVGTPLISSIAGLYAEHSYVNFEKASLETALERLLKL